MATKSNKIHSFKRALFAFILPFPACQSTKKTIERAPNFEETLTLNVVGIMDLMPGTNSKPYIIVSVSTTESAFNESFRLKELQLKSSNGKWTKTTFDFDYYAEKETNSYENVARDFDAGIGNSMDAKVTFETASGKIFVLKKEGVRLESVY